MVLHFVPFYVTNNLIKVLLQPHILEFKKVCISYPVEMFKFIGQGKTPGSFVLQCQIGDCANKNNTLATYWNSRGNIMKHLKVPLFSLV